MLPNSNSPFTTSLIDRWSDQSERWIPRLPDKQIRQESILTSADLKNVVYWHDANKIQYNVHSCLFCALSKYE